MESLKIERKKKGREKNKEESWGIPSQVGSHSRRPLPRKPRVDVKGLVNESGSIGALKLSM
jgi:hypothetical protein